MFSETRISIVKGKRGGC